MSQNMEAAKVSSENGSEMPKPNYMQHFKKIHLLNYQKLNQTIPHQTRKVDSQQTSVVLKMPHKKPTSSNNYRLIRENGNCFFISLPYIIMSSLQSLTSDLYWNCFFSYYHKNKSLNTRKQ